MSGPVLVGLDLDNTVLYSRAGAAAAGAQPYPRAGGAGWKTLERREGRAAGWTTARCAQALEELDERCVLVAATTRTPEQLERVRLPGRHPRRWAVASNGAVLLRDGEVDQEWGERVTAALRATSAPLAEAYALLGAAVAGAQGVRVKSVAGGFCYAVRERGAPWPASLDLTRRWAKAAGWTWSDQGRKVYLVPAALSKESALAEVARRCAPAYTLAAGDSLLDAGMLTWARAAMRPAHGELGSWEQAPAHLQVSVRSGIEAGEEIAQWLLGQVLAQGERSAESTA